MQELHNERLRQGWGYDERQDLRNLQMDGGAKKNKPIFEKVKKGDTVLVPRLPKWGEVAIVEATEDWNKGYYFDPLPDYGDYGHVFPAKFLKKFKRHNPTVSGNIRSTLRNPSRFWNVNQYAEDIDKILNQPQDELEKEEDKRGKFESNIGDVFNEIFDDEDFKGRLYNKFTESLTHEEWEFMLVHGLRKLFPGYQIERVGGKKEREHGTDVLVKMPGLLGEYEYGIAIQVKDYSGQVDNNVLNQINKSVDYYQENEDLKIVEKVLLVTEASKESNQDLNNNKQDIKVIMASELKDLIGKFGKSALVDGLDV
jgi:hypothetical protein